MSFLSLFFFLDTCIFYSFYYYLLQYYMYNYYLYIITTNSFNSQQARTWQRQHDCYKLTYCLLQEHRTELKSFSDKVAEHLAAYEKSIQGNLATFIACLSQTGQRKRDFCMFGCIELWLLYSNCSKRWASIIDYWLLRIDCWLLAIDYWVLIIVWYVSGDTIAYIHTSITAHIWEIQLLMCYL